MTAVSGAPRVGIVIVSHSALIAAGVTELARQMAPDVTLESAGGTDDGGLGTSFGKVASALNSALAGAGNRVGAAADSASGVVVLSDLGSAGLIAQTAREFLDERDRERVVVVDAPLVEGAVAAAVAAQIGGDLNAVIAAAENARGVQAPSAEPELSTPGPAAPSSTAPSSTAPSSAKPTGTSGGSTRYARTVTLINRDGLHARPAADFVRLAATFSARVTVNGKDAKSLLGIMSLGLLRGARVELSAVTDAAASDGAASDGAASDGAASDGVAAVDALAQLIESGFGEDSPV
ncbi:dihydroxyacetone kinase phosphoryl donor subunit DhaM [Rathayibacter soli]|uniref:dihydroxyacetone kinase phosphoryl donor subunit DhaM n=1 Tax=Rathayibacter soli TaxID=3144168 RepID=UPI0027E592F2|nr:dihydroxyacetone kinase phosphoryl donor subunit DhaM [Glaciibacter superstes]